MVYIVSKGESAKLIEAKPPTFSGWFDGKTEKFLLGSIQFEFHVRTRELKIQNAKEVLIFQQGLSGSLFTARGTVTFKFDPKKACKISKLTIGANKIFFKYSDAMIDIDRNTKVVKVWGQHVNVNLF